MQTVPARTAARSPIRLGALGGLVPALAGVLGYVAVPLLTSRYADGLNLASEVAVYFFARSPGYHLAVLVVPSFLVTLVLLGHDERTDRAGLLDLFGGLVATPVGAVVLVFLVAMAAIAAVAPAFVPWVFLFGFPVLAVIAGLVTALVGVGALGGYLAVRGAARWRRGG